MKIEKIEPRTITYRLCPDREDKEYSSCMWARYIFDCDNGILNINSDAGNYTYGWGYNVHEDFMHLMGRVDKEYLLGKLSSLSVFLIEESKAKTIENIKEYGFEYWGIKDQKHLESAIEHISDIDICASEETFIREVSEIVPGIDWEWIEVVKDYPYGAAVVVEMFIKYLQPKIREAFRAN